MATVAPAGGATTETNIYDANGDRLVRRDSTGTTLYLPGQEIRRASNGTTTGTRYYTLAGTTCASRTPSGVSWLYDDHQGTQQIAINAGTQAVRVRRQTPYGGPRGSNPAWPTQKGFVGGDNDPTGLVNIGARQYDPGLGRFISVDPVMDLSDPQQWNAYAYAGNTPVTNADPTGLRDECGGGTGNYSCINSNGSVSSNTKLTGEAKQQYDKVLDQIREKNKRKNKCGWRCKASKGWNKVKGGYNAVNQWAQEHSQLVGAGIGIAAGIMAGTICTAVTVGIGAVGCTMIGGMIGGAIGAWATNYLDSDDQSAQQYAEDMMGAAAISAVPIPGGGATRAAVKGAAEEVAEQTAKRAAANGGLKALPSGRKDRRGVGRGHLQARWAHVDDRAHQLPPRL